MSFVHLHNHTEFSILDGSAKIKDLVKTAADLNMPAMAITDHGVMYGNLIFYTEARSAGIKPILGCEVYVAPRSMADKDPHKDKDRYHLILLAKNNDGYKNLIKIVSTAFSEGFYYKPRVDKELLDRYSDGLIAMSACLGGEIPHHILKGDPEAADRSLGQYIDIFGKDDFYIELQDHGMPEQKKVNAALYDMAKKTGLKVVGTNDIHYTKKSDARSHDILLCIQTGSTINEPGRFKFETDEFYMKTEEEMRKALTDYPEAIENTLEVADKCNVEFNFGRSKLPDPGVPEGIPPSKYMEDEAWKGLTARLGHEPPPEYKKQFDYECKIINDCGFPLYMLIVRDFTDFARKAGMYVGARGSAASSLVGYGLGITDVDPIDFDLAFERFLNPERVEMPDVDLDIQDDRREELIEYVCQKYGRANVGQIATFGSMKARQAVRDCGRVLGMDLGFTDRITKMIPTMPLNVKIKDALEMNPDLKKEYDSDPKVKELLDTAMGVEGTNRSVGIHAAGVLISDDPLTDHVPVHYGGKGEYVAQMAKKDIAKIGLLKMDFLGLANLTILANSIKNVKKSRGIDIDIMNIPLDDKATYEMLGRGDTNGVFQLESAGMRKNVVELKPASVRELAAIVALYRPGPMAFIPKFIRSKFGKEPIKYLHPQLEPILKETYGVICYQEQVMRIARAIGGFTLGQADVLRKAMSSKSKEIMDAQREKFLKGAVENGVDEKTASAIYEQVQPFAGYAFNKAHAVCYAFVAYRTAYMKANYTAEYYAALISANMDDKEKLAMYVDDCKRFGVAVYPPDVNKSYSEFTIENGGIRFGFCAIKGCGKAAMDALAEERAKNGDFKDIFDLTVRLCDNNALNKGSLEALIKVGAFDSIEPNRAKVLMMLPDALAMAASKRKDAQTGQDSLFGDEEVFQSADMSQYENVNNYDKDQIFAMEKFFMGIYLSGHPLDDLRGYLEANTNANANTIKELENRTTCTMGGLLRDVSVIITKKNEKMARAKLEDLYGSTNVIFFPRAYKACEGLLVPETAVLVKGKVSKSAGISDEEEGGGTAELLGETVVALDKSAAGSADSPEIKSDMHILLKEDVNLEFLKKLLASNPGGSKVYFHIDNRAKGGKVDKFAVPMRVSPDPGLIGDIKKLAGVGGVKLR
ncbi:MAG: DNA polymerase III subunit alpha [Abditibacteriota bacterium]|nr:DNA polymerase III subunit alpha [Abditibacteriota bacterium]